MHTVCVSHDSQVQQTRIATLSLVVLTMLLYQVQYERANNQRHTNSDTTSSEEPSISTKQQQQQQQQKLKRQQSNDSTTTIAIGIKMGHSHSTLREARRKAASRSDTGSDVESLQAPAERQAGSSLALARKAEQTDHDSPDKRKTNDNDDEDNIPSPERQTIDVPSRVYSQYTPAPVPKSEDYLPPTSHDDENVPLGRLKAFCPYGPVQEPPVHEVVASLLAKNAKAIKAAEKVDTVRMARAHRSMKLPRSPRNNNALVSLRDDIDVLAARGLYNAACSPLCRLPDDVLVRIMGHLGWDDLLFLRHTSRAFMRLFGCRGEFESLRDDNAINNNSGLFVLPTPWPPLALPAHNARLWVNLRRRYQSAAHQYQCAGCRSAPKRFLQAEIFMHCTACHVDHPAELFSWRQIQRDKETAAHRVCIAHEGHVRLCQHKTVDWATVIKSLPGGHLDNNFRNAFYTGQMSSAEGGNSRFSVDADLRVVCDHPSHGAHPHHTGQVKAGQTTTADTDDTDDGQLPPYERFTADDHAERPSFVVHDMMVDGVKHKVITWSYTAHMDLADLGNRDNKGAITAQAFRDHIHELRKGHSAARYIAPPDYPGILHELRCIDPERCACLLYPGFRRRTSDAATPMACRKHEVVRVLNSHVANIDHIHVRLASCDRAPRCLKLIYTRTIRLEGFCINPDRAWPPALLMGRRLSNIGYYRRLRDAFRNESVPLGWYQALDPQSYHVTEDPDRHHLLWCRGRSCQLNPRYLRSRPFDQAFEMNAECVWGCENSKQIGFDQTGREAKDGYFITIPLKEQWGYWRALKQRRVGGWVDGE